MSDDDDAELLSDAEVLRRKQVASEHSRWDDPPFNADDWE